MRVPEPGRGDELKRKPMELDISCLPEEIQQRWPMAVNRAQTKVEQISSNAETAQPLIQASQRARTVAQRVVWLRRAASAWAKPVEGVAACRPGCSHCCHIPVLISHTEAEVIGAAIRRAPRRPAHPISIAELQSAEDLREAEVTLRASRATGEPCPFLVAHACSIYAHRPFACRTLLNLDDDDLLCRLVPGVEVPVPYADATQLKAFYLAAQPNAELADIREFFPS